MVTEAPAANAAPPARSNLLARLPSQLIAAVIAFAVCAHAYALHKRVVIDWWTWAAEFILSAAFLVVALREPDDVTESAVRRWARRLFGIASIALLFAAIHYGGRTGRELSSGIATAAALIAFLIFRWVPISKADALCLNGDDAKTARSNIIAWILSLAGVAMAAAATALNRSDHLTGLCLWLAGLIVLAIGIWRAGSGAAAAAPNRWHLESGPLLTRGGEALAVTLTLLFGIALRVPFLDRVPAYINSDEGRLHRYALSLYKDGFPDFFALGWNAFPNISVLVDVVPIQILGMGIDKLRLASAIFGLASLLFTYFWARRWWGNVVALLAMLMLTFNQEHINWSRVGMNNIQQVLVGVAMLATFASALQRRRPLDWLLFGYACGFTFLTYHAAKLFPAILFAVFVVWAIGIRGFLRRNFGGGVIALIGFLVVLGPHLVTIYVDWFNFYHNTSNRVDLPVLFDAYQARNYGGVRNYLTSHVLATLYLFTLHELPFLDRFLFIAALPGIGWMLWRWRDPRHTVVLAWIGGILLIGGMITAYPPNVPRLIGVLPVACIIPAVVAGRLRGLLYRTQPARADLIIVPALILWLSMATYSNLQTEFVLRTWMQGNDQMTHVCRTLGATPLPATAYTVGGLGEVDTGIAPIDCMMPLDVDRTSVGLTDDPSLFPIRPANKGTAVFVFTKAQFELLDLARHYYPDARYEALLNRDGMPHLWTATMTPEVIQKHRGLQLTWTRGQYPEESTVGLDTIQCPGCLSFPVEAVGRGLVHIAAPGQYAFRAPHTKIQIDGRGVDSDTAVSLPAGWHTLRAQAQLQRIGHNVVLEWKTPDNPEWHPIERAFLNTHPVRHGLLGRYFTHSLPIAEPEPSLAKPDYEQIVTALAFDANPERDEKPPAGFASKGATMEWIGTVEFPEGDTQSLRLDTTSPTKVFLNGVEVLDNHGGAPNSPTEATLVGLKGPTKILVRTVREAEPKVWYWWLRLSWKQPGGDWASFVDYKPPAQ